MAGDDDDEREPGKPDAGTDADAKSAAPDEREPDTDEIDVPVRPPPSSSDSHPSGDSSGSIHSRRAVRIRPLPPASGDGVPVEPIELGTADEETFELGPVVDIAALPRGTTIAGHVLLGRLGEDALGPIYTAYDPEGDRKLALRLLPVPADDPEAAESQLALVDELAAISRLSHPCIVAVRDVGVWSGGVYVAMDFFDGIDLSTWIEARDEPFPWREVVRVFREAGRALAAAHAGGVLHRDFTPEKVLMGKDGQVRVVDFALARLEVDDAEDLDPIARLRERLGLRDADELPREIGGTIEYAAPEVLVGEVPDARADEFSFCVALYEALYGERPYAGEQRTAIATEMAEGRLRSAPAGTSVPTWLRDIVVRGLAVRPADRWSSMEKLLRELDRDPAASRRRWQRGLALVAVLGGATAGIAWWVRATQERCAAGDVELAGTWDQERRIELERAFMASGRPYAADNWRAVADTIDAWAKGWARLQAEACEATRVRGDASEELYARRRECLDAHLAELHALLGVLESVEPTALDAAWIAASRLQSPRMCIHLAGLDEVDHPKDADVERIVDARARIDRGRALVHLGRAPAAAELARELRGDVDGLQHPGLQAAAVRLTGEADAALGHPAAAETALLDAVRRAERDELDYARALAWIELAALLARNVERLDEAGHTVDYAATLLERIHDEERRWTIAVIRAEIAERGGRTTEALARYHEALTDLDRIGAPMWARIRVLQSLGELVASRGDLAAAEGYYSRALSAARDRLGAGHPLLATPLIGIGNLQSSRKATADAQASWERALQILSDAHGPAAAPTVRALLGIAGRLREDGDPLSALDYDRRALVAVEREPTRDDALLVSALVDQARSLLALGRDRQAVPLLTRAAETTEASHRGAARTGTAEQRRDAAARVVEVQGLLSRALWSDKPSRPRALELAGEVRELANEHKLAIDPWVASVAEHISEGSAP
jgi:tetratricopeptide (TPR) repeat protein